MGHKGKRANYLDSSKMPFFTRHRWRRGRLAALLICFATLPFLAGCAEDRSNLIPQETSNSLITKLNRVDQLAAEGDCFGAQEVATSAQAEIEEGNFDPELQRSLLDGVSQLVEFLGNSEKCTQVDTTPEEEEPTDLEEESFDTDGTTGTTGTTDTTDTGSTTTGEQGTTPDQDQPGDENGNQPSRTPPSTNPTPPTTPPTTPPSTPTPPGPGSGGIGPG